MRCVNFIYFFFSIKKINSNFRCILMCVQKVIHRRLRLQ